MKEIQTTDYIRKHLNYKNEGGNMNNEIRYLVKWRTNRPHEKGKVFEWQYKTLEKALECKEQEESIKENIEVKIFKVEITEIQ